MMLLAVPGQRIGFGILQMSVVCDFGGRSAEEHEVTLTRETPNGLR